MFRSLWCFEQLEVRRVLTNEIEPNDTPATATTFTSNGTIVGTVLNTLDVDYFKVNLPQGSLLSINTDNLNNGTFNQALPPPVDILDSAGNLVATGKDGRTVSYTTPSAGDYFVRMNASSAFGIFTYDYAMQSSVTNYSGVTEAEPNDSAATANSLTMESMFRGSVTGSDPADWYSFQGAVGDKLVVDFTGVADSVPGVTLRNSSGNVLATALDGLGLTATLNAADTYTIQIGANAAGQYVGQYVGVVNKYASALVSSDAGDGFDTAAAWNVASSSQQAVTGSLTSLTDVDVYQFDVTTNDQLTFRLQNTTAEQIFSQGKVLTLSNSQGQFLSYSLNGSLSGDRVDALAPGRYFIAVTATSVGALGTYALEYSSNDFFGNVRDTTMHFIDFNQQEPTHQGYSWVSSYGVPAAIPFVVGMVDSRYTAYDVETTLTKLTDGSERIDSGYGNFGDIGAGGWGGGNYGVRRSNGDTVIAANDTTWTSLSYGATIALAHEMGHATGMPHARLATALMGYVNSDELIPIGDGFSFPWTDSRRPGFSVMNERNYLDWTLQSGSQAFSIEPNDSSAQAQLLIPYFNETTLDVLTKPTVATGQAPVQVLTGDFNNDGKRDLVIASSDSDDLRVYLGDGTGNVTFKNSVSVDDLNWFEEPITVGDFNGDGRSDVAVISRSNNRFGILLSAADGTLGAASYTASGNTPISIATGDVNKDSKLDIIMGLSSGAVMIHIGAGNGTFAAGQSYAGTGNVYSLSVVDFNGDGYADIASGDNGGGAGVRINDGTGKFPTRTSIGTGDSVTAVTTGDYNGDGRIDIAYINRSTDQAFVALAKAGGGFNTATASEGHRNGEAMTTADVNRDGRADLIIGGFDTSMVVLLSNPDGTMGRPIDYSTSNAEYGVAAADLTNDGFADIVTAAYFSDTFSIFVSQPDNLRNNRVTLMGAISSATDVDRYSLAVKAGETYTFDIEAAEFQYSLDATIRLIASDGTVLATNTSGLDRDSGLDSVDPYLTYTFTADDTIQIEVSGESGSAGNYRFKVTPSTAYKIDGPRVIASYPDNGTSQDTLNQLMFFLDDQIDPATITSSSIVVRGQAGGVRSGTAYFNPLDATLTWTASSPLPIDSYTVTLSGGTNGLKDFAGASLDGEIASNFKFPTVSGNGTPGGDYTMQFTISSNDTTAATVSSVSYSRDPYQRGKFTLVFSDQLSEKSVDNATFTLRAAGPDHIFGTTDDRLATLDPIYDKIDHINYPSIDLYSRGIPDPDQYRIEASLVDAAGLTVALSQVINVAVAIPETALFSNAGLTQTGLVGSYINQSLRSQTAQVDWRSSQTVAGTRTDYTVSFPTSSFGTRAQVGITGGSDANWDNFSVQWDGWIKVSVDGTRVQTRSDDGSRYWIDVNNDGTFANNASEFFDNGFGTGHAMIAGALSAPLTAGTYRIRVQYEEGTGSNGMVLEWMTPDTPGMDDQYGHGPTVIGMTVPANSVVNVPTSSVGVTFSGALDLTTLTTTNFKVRYSPDPTFYNGNDSYLTDADNAISWNATTHTATFQPASILTTGYYLVELTSGAGGIKAPGGMQLDGEYLNTKILGNTTYPRWSDTPSGDGIPGGNYSASFTVGITEIRLSISPSSISEFGGSAVGTVTRVNAADYSAPLTVTLTNSDTTEASVPVTVTIPAGAQSTTFAVLAVDDSIVDGDQIVTISASASGFATGAAQITVTDYEPLVLTIDVGSISENGGVAHATVKRTDPTGSLSVTILNSNGSRLSVPAVITIPAGQLTSASFNLSAIDNNLVDGNQLITISASASGYLNAVQSLTVNDEELLAISINPTTISESGQAQAVVTRTDPNGVLTVNITTDAPDEVSVPATVTIAAGSLSSLPFTINGVADGILDGLQTAHVRAAATGYIDAVGTINVLDGEQIALQFNSPTMSEKGGTIQVQAMRTASQGALVVQLSTTSSGQITFPSSITIADGQLLSAPFTISAVDNQILDGDRDVPITVIATGYSANTSTIRITDYEPITFTVLGSAQISENGGSTTVIVSRTDSTSAVTISLSSNDTSEATLPGQVTIPAGFTSSGPITISAVDDTLLDGDQSVTISAAAGGYVTGTQSILVTDYEELDLTFDQSSIAEDGRTAIATIKRKNTDLGSAVTINLSSNDVTELTVPASVTIPAGQASATFTVTSVDDTLLDGTQSPQITAGGSGYISVSKVLNVTDVETITAALSVSSISEQGGTTVLRLTRSNTDSATALTVNLSNSNASRVSSPATAVIPSGAQFVDVPISAVDDDLLTGSVSATLGGSSAGYFSVTAALIVTDYETLTIVPITSSISEKGGTTSATITRSNTNNSSALTVSLVSSDTTELTVPASVTIPAGQSSVSFTLTAVDDTLLDGPQVVLITPTAAGYISNVLSETVTDFEQLDLTFNKTALAEDSRTAIGTVKRNNTDISQALTVSLSSNDTTELSVPASVTIPAGQSTVTFTATSVDDTLLDGLQTGSVTASAAGYVSGSASMDITDVENLTIAFSQATIYENNATTQMTVSRSNTDTATAQVVSLSTTNGLRTNAPASVTIPAGSQSVTIDVTSIDDTLLGNSEDLTFGVAASGYFGSQTTLTVNDYETLTISLDKSHISENGGSAQMTVTRSNTNSLSALVIAVSSSDQTELSTPATVTIPLNQRSVTFSVNAVDDQLLDGDQTVTLTVAAGGYITGQSPIIVDDYEPLTLVLDQTQVSEAGGTLTGRVSRAGSDLTSSLVVNLSTSIPGTLNLPSSITITAGSSSASFSATGIDNAIWSGDRTVSLTASSTGYVSGIKSFTLADAETLAIVYASATISEQGGSTTATLSRSNTNIEAAVSVTLVSDDPSVTFPSSVTIPAGSSSVGFTVNAIDDDLLNGLRSIHLAANSAGYQSTSDVLTVTDYESLTMTILSTSMSEKGGFIVGTVRRNNQDISLPLVVSLSSNDTTEATAPATVTIPANTIIATFTVLAVDDTILDGDQIVTISASSSGYVGAQRNLTVTDDETADTWTNPRNPLDVNNDTFVSAIDALLIINQLNQTGGGKKLGTPPVGNTLFYDCNADTFLSAIDALFVINYLNSHPNGEGEGEGVESIARDQVADIETTPLFSMDAWADIAAASSVRQRRARDQFFADFGI
ncbi:MAG: FG-GAP-like repeat-containing protein [Pirellulales bacterium]